MLENKASWQFGKLASYRVGKSAGQQGQRGGELARAASGEPAKA